MGQIRAERRHRSWSLLGALAVGIVLMGGSNGVALAHKDKLPPDALSLVRQAAALLAQDPKMSGEAKERLEAALKSKDPLGVDLAKVRQALDALTARDIPRARRALAEATAPSASGPPSPQPSPGMVPGMGTAPAADAIAKMKMAEPLIARYEGTSAEVTTLLAGLVLVVAGVIMLRRGG